jgi:hypothetical protein
VRTDKLKRLGENIGGVKPGERQNSLMRSNARRKRA